MKEEGLLEDTGHYLELDQPLLALSTIYFYLLEDSTRFSLIEMNFEKTYGGAVRSFGKAKLKVFCEKYSDTIEVLLGKKSLFIQKRLKHLNPLFLQIMLDYHCDLNSLHVKSDKLGKLAIRGFESEFYIFKHKKCLKEQAQSFEQTGLVDNYLVWNKIVKVKIENYKIEKKQLAVKAQEEFAKKLVESNGAIKVFAKEFDDHNNMEIMEKTETKRFRVIGYKDKDARVNSIIGALEEAKTAQCAIVVFPELTVSSYAKSMISRWLNKNKGAIPLVVAGSWHEKSSLSEEDHIANQCTVFDFKGAEVFTHSKLTQFNYNGLAEDIILGSTITFMDLPIGLSTVLICKDFCDEMTQIHNVTKLTCPEFILVPTMGIDSTLRAHEKTYKRLLVTSKPAVFLVNQHPPSEDEEALVRGRCYPGTYKTTNELNKENFIKYNDKQSYELLP